MSYTGLTLYRRLLKRIRPYWLHFLSIYLLGLLVTHLSLLALVPLAIVVDSVLGDLRVRVSLAEGGLGLPHRFDHGRNAERLRFNII